MPTRKPASSEAPLAAGQQTIEQLQQRYEQLNTKKIQSATLLQSARKQLDALQSEAREKYGTDDLAALQAKLQQMKDENEQKRAAYQVELDRIDADLAQVEQNFRATESNAAKGTA